MTVSEFQHKYHEYAVDTKEEALKEIAGMENVTGHTIVPVYFNPPGKWCLMLDTAARYWSEISAK